MGISSMIQFDDIVCADCMHKKDVEADPCFVLEMIFRQIEKAVKGDASSLFGGAA